MLDYVKKITSSRTLEELWDHHCRSMEEYGFDRLMYGASHFITSNSVGPSEDILFLTSHDAEYVKHYKDGEMFRYAPMIVWARENTGAGSWRWIHENAEWLDEKAHRVIQLNKRMGVTAGYTISFPVTSLRSKGLIALAAKRGMSQDDVDELWNERGAEIEACNTVAHLKILSLPLQTDRVKLSARQREVLDWVGDGKTNLDIATILGVTPTTVEKHLRIARDKLGVETTAQAVLKMSLMNQIYVQKT